MMKKALIVLALLVLSGLAVFFLVVPDEVGKRMNATLTSPPYEASEKARELHRKLIIADLHADSLLWGRDLTRRAAWGHVDIPRLIEGNVALQAFTVVTKTPMGLNIERNSDRSDNILLLAIAQRWPVATLRSLKERAIYQAARLQQMADRSSGKLTVLKTASDLDLFLDRRQREQGIVGGILGIEGAHALDGKLENVDALFDAGFRMMSPTHFFDNQVGGSAHGLAKGGLTPLGRDVVRRMEAKGMLVDLAHASAKTINDVLSIATRPVVVSHTGVRGTCDNNRNLSDAQLRNIAQKGGVIGIGYWDTAVCGTDASAIARAIRYAVDTVGVDHVGLGSDYDGAIAAPFDTSGVVEITGALMKENFTEEEIGKIMGGNVVRLWQTSLPK
jgi:microsomal dipeptidase-like Zn-dependent dipeptidase